MFRERAFREWIIVARPPTPGGHEETVTERIQSFRGETQPSG
jgi:hypothetical protein